MIFIQFFNHQSFLEGHSLIASSHLVLFLLSFPYLGIILGIKKSTQTKNFSPRALNYRLFNFHKKFISFRLLSLLINCFFRFKIKQDHIFCIKSQKYLILFSDLRICFHSRRHLLPFVSKIKISLCSQHFIDTHL